MRSEDVALVRNLADSRCYVQVYRGSLLPTMSDGVSKQQEDWLCSFAEGLWTLRGSLGAEGSGGTINCSLLPRSPPPFISTLNLGEKVTRTLPWDWPMWLRPGRAPYWLTAAVSVIVQLQDCARWHTSTFSTVDIWSRLIYSFCKLK